MTDIISKINKQHEVLKKTVYSVIGFGLHSMGFNDIAVQIL